ncbi:UNKNOWN [Stylonychia lemnae]|uniref:Uncharacterized protein n=1 Tax=Stylonychia lemnae TaxID=5949 RepID=A0A078AJ15_STYLE|nr:UNKNOWN [Stylonychia lemnae]|eukprot:CDW82320.1 UNKNOWN [Stylonychia lemnae]
MVSLLLNYIQNIRCFDGKGQNIFYTVLISFIADPFLAVFYNVAIQIIYLRLSPARYQASMSSIFLSIAIISQSFLSTPIALALNDQFAQVTKYNIEDIYKLKYIQMIFCMGVVPFIFLLPNFDRFNRFNSALAELGYDRDSDEPITVSDIIRLNPNSLNVVGTHGENSADLFISNRKSITQKKEQAIRTSLQNQN